MTLVFVYGTLKRGFLNYEDYLRPSVALGKAAIVAEATTVDNAFCLVLRKERQVPCLYRPQPGVEQGYSVPGEVFRVDPDALRALDILEGVDEASYYREEIAVTLTSDDASGEFKAGDTIQCQIYLKVFSDDLVPLENVPSYTAEHHVAYKSRFRTPKLQILECIYGKDVTDLVQKRVDDGAEFVDAWKAVVG